MRFLSPDTVFAHHNASRLGLPTWTYNNPELTELEIEQIFLCSWLWVGHVSDIPDVGDYQCFNFADERALIIRGEDNVVRAFHNVCSHRASRVVPDEKGHCKNAMVCPFHGWSYHLDGRLKNVPRPTSFPEFDKSKMGLPSIDCEVWHGMIFVRFKGDGPSVAEMFAEAEDEISLYRIDDMQPLDASWKMEFDLDWKSLVDIDGEGYHVPVGHPELYDLVGTSYCDQVLESGLNRSHSDIDAGKHHSALNREYAESLPKESYLPASHQRQWIYWGAYPAIVITLFPDMVEIYQIYPTGAHTSAMAGRCYALEDKRPEMGRARDCNRKINTTVGQEDMHLMEWAAAGMRSSAYRRSMLSDLEVGVGAFQNQLRDKLPVVSLETSPAKGTVAQTNHKMLDQAGAEMSVEAASGH